MTHRPPTVFDDTGIDTRKGRWLTARDTERLGIYLYHYSLLLPKQIRDKCAYYNDPGDDPSLAHAPEIVRWAEHCYFTLGHPFRVHNVYTTISWLYRHGGATPEQIRAMWDDIQAGVIDAEIRSHADIEALLARPGYRLAGRALNLLSDFGAVACSEPGRSRNTWFASSSGRFHCACNRQKRDQHGFVMRILWFAAGAMPFVREQLDIKDFGNRNVWVAAAAMGLAEREGVELGIVWASSLVAEPAEYRVGNITYYCVPVGGPLEKISNRLIRWPALRKVWQALTYLPRQSVGRVLHDLQDIIAGFRPDIIHVHGTEGFYGLLASRTPVPVLISLQGILQAVADAYWGAIPLVGRLRFPKELLLHRKMRGNARRENQIIRQGRYFSGRTDWDRMMLKSINPAAEYFSDGARLLREEFYSASWSVQSCVRHRLYTTATSRPYKGTETLLEAVAILRNRYPDVTLHIGGDFPNAGYGAFLRRKLVELELADHVQMLGFVEAADIVAELKAANAYLIGSYIENSPNSVAEAQLAGTPTIATNVGGTPSLVEDGVSGILYPPGNADFLAAQISRVFDDDRLAESLGRGGQEQARSRGGKAELVDILEQIYVRILAGRA